MILIEIFMLH